MRAKRGAGNGARKASPRAGARIKSRSTQAPALPPSVGTPRRRKSGETDLHEQVAAFLARVIRLPAMWTCFPAGNIPLPRAYAVKLARMGLRRGWPDFLIVHGRAYGIELKTDAGRLSKGRFVTTRKGRTRYAEGQEDVVGLLEAAGMEVAICRSLADVMAALAEWNIPTLTARIAA